MQMALWSVFSRAKEAPGSEQDTLQWLGTPIPASDYATPILHLAQPNGQQDVLTVLGRLERGVF